MGECDHPSSTGGENCGRGQGGRRLPDLCAQTSPRDRMFTQEVRAPLLKASGVRQGAKSICGKWRCWEDLSVDLA